MMFGFVAFQKHVTHIETGSNKFLGQDKFCGFHTSCRLTQPNFSMYSLAQLLISVLIVGFDPSAVHGAILIGSTSPARILFILQVKVSISKYRQTQWYVYTCELFFLLQPRRCKHHISLLVHVAFSPLWLR